MSDNDVLTMKEEAYCQAYVLNNGNSTAAWRQANPESTAKPETQHSQASITLAKPKVRARIAELQDEARAIATDKFTITVEQRLRWLKDIVEAGLDVYIDQNGNKRRENLAASRAAVATVNDILGVSGDDKAPAESGVTIVIKRDDGARKVDVVEQ